MKKQEKNENELRQEKLLTTKEFAREARISVAHVYRLVHQRVISYYKSTGGKYTYIPERELRRYLTAVYVPSNAERDGQG